MGRFSAENLPMSIIITIFAHELKNGATAYVLFKHVSPQYLTGIQDQRHFLLFNVDSAGIMFSIQSSEYWPELLLCPANTAQMPKTNSYEVSKREQDCISIIIHLYAVRSVCGGQPTNNRKF